MSKAVENKYVRVWVEVARIKEHFKPVSIIKPLQLDPNVDKRLTAGKARVIREAVTAIRSVGERATLQGVMSISGASECEVLAFTVKYGDL